MAKPPTVNAFVKQQESWASHVLTKIQAKIEDREEYLREQGWNVDDLSDDQTLMDLYDEELFYIRYGEEMVKQRKFIQERYFHE